MSQDNKPKREMVWVCARCNRKQPGNPRRCPWCGHTVYRPEYPEPATTEHFRKPQHNVLVLALQARKAEGGPAGRMAGFKLWQMGEGERVCL